MRDHWLQPHDEGCMWVNCKTQNRKKRYVHCSSVKKILGRLQGGIKLWGWRILGALTVFDCTYNRSKHSKSFFSKLDFLHLSVTRTAVTMLLVNIFLRKYVLFFFIYRTTQWSGLTEKILVTFYIVASCVKRKPAGYQIFQSFYDPAT